VGVAEAAGVFGFSPLEQATTNKSASAATTSHAAKLIGLLMAEPSMNSKWRDLSSLLLS